MWFQSKNLLKSSAIQIWTENISISKEWRKNPTYCYCKIYAWHPHTQIRGNIFPWSREVMKVANLHEDKYVIFAVFHLKSKSKISIVKIPLSLEKKTAFSSHIPNTKDESQRSFKTDKIWCFVLIKQNVPSGQKDSVFSSSPPGIRELSRIWRWGTGIILVCGGEEVQCCCQQSSLWISLRLRRNPFQIKFHWNHCLLVLYE